MGDVFAASDLELDRRVAVKVLVERFADDESCRRRFKREALAAARLSVTPMSSPSTTSASGKGGRSS